MIRRFLRNLLFGRVSIRLTPYEAEYLLDALDIWIDGYRDTEKEADDDEVEPLLDSLDLGISVRYKVYRGLEKII